MGPLIPSLRITPPVVRLGPNRRLFYLYPDPVSVRLGGEGSKVPGMEIRDGPSDSPRTGPKRSSSSNPTPSYSWSDIVEGRSLLPLWTPRRVARTTEPTGGEGE